MLTALLDRLVREGRLRFTPGTGDDGTGQTVTYHDPCYPGRHNEVYDLPRELRSGCVRCIPAGCQNVASLSLS